MQADILLAKAIKVLALSCTSVVALQHAKRWPLQLMTTSWQTDAKISKTE